MARPEAEKWCVCASHGADADGSLMAFGDGWTACASRLYAVCDTKAEAEKALARLMKTKTMTRKRVPGDGIVYPVLEVHVFKPLRFTMRQGREEIVGARYKAFVGGLPVLAEFAAAALDK